MPGPFPPDESRPEPIGKQPSVGHAALDDDHANLRALTPATTICPRPWPVSRVC